MSWKEGYSWEEDDHSYRKSRTTGEPGRKRPKGKATLAERIVRNPNYRPVWGHWATLNGQLRSLREGSKKYEMVKRAMEKSYRKPPEPKPIFKPRFYRERDIW